MERKRVSKMMLNTKEPLLIRGLTSLFWPCNDDANARERKQPENVTVC